MKNLVYDLSRGEFRSRKELFAQPISEHNVRLIGELIAVSSVRTLLPFFGKQMDRLYCSLIKDIHHLYDPDYILSDGYDVAQTAVCFLWQFNGRKLTEIYGNTSHRKNVTILNACYSEVSSYLMQFRKKITHTQAMDSTDDRHYCAAPAEPYSEEDYDKAEALMDEMKLTERQREIISYYMSGLRACEIARLLCIDQGSVTHMRAYVRKKYIACFSGY